MKAVVTGSAGFIGSHASIRQKIKAREAVAEIIGRRPRAKNVVMCHGTFDIVHPGHLRHLMYAKEKADLLIASLTADVQITKANYRPYVPEELRATNLAALEIVDWVLIDPHPTPIENILFLQPDYFAKGYEYLSNGVAARTREEMDAVQSYGGEMLFTPGDIVYSSSALMDAQLPRIAVDKLLALMESERIGFGDLRRALQQLEGIRVHIVGDTIVDLYSYCSLLGATAKSPTFSVRYQRSERFAGGAAAVARHMRAAQACVTLSTVLGDDAGKDFVVQEMALAGTGLLPIIDPMRPTTEKERFFAEGQKMLQVDRVDNQPIGERTVDALAAALRSTGTDVVVCSDFRHGMFNRDTVEDLKAAIPPGALKVADSQVSNRWGNILDFTDFDLITPNEREARFALGDQDSVIRPLALRLFREARCRTLLLKLGERGLLGYRSPGSNPREFFAVDSFADIVSDPIGAGDALLAYASLTLRATDNVVIAAILGSIAAAVECERQGNVPVTPAEAERKIDLLEKLANYR
jgi:rfaE bifunctional protein kinase chain/domain